MIEFNGKPTDAQSTAILRQAGCQCSKPLLGWRPKVGPRCRLCNTEGKLLPHTVPTWTVLRSYWICFENDPFDRNYDKHPGWYFSFGAWNGPYETEEAAQKAAAEMQLEVPQS